MSGESNQYRPSVETCVFVVARRSGWDHPTYA